MLIHMKRATVEEAGQGLAALLDAAKAGEDVVITEDGVVVARLVAEESPAEETDDELLDRLHAAGIIKRGKRITPALKARLLAPFPEGSKPAGVLDALLEERRTGW